MENKKELTFYEKLSDIQANLKAPKNQKNNFGGYKYRSCEDILEAVKPLLSKHHLSLFIGDDIVLVGDRYYIKATAIVSDGDKTAKNTAYAREPLSKKGMDEAQITGATSSYARKYALNGLLCIDDTKDPDTQDNTQKTGLSAPKAKGEVKDKTDIPQNRTRIPQNAKKEPEATQTTHEEPKAVETTVETESQRLNRLLKEYKAELCEDDWKTCLKHAECKDGKIDTKAKATQMIKLCESALGIQNELSD